MVQFENQYRQIKVKIVYYGPALGGKTTCLQHVHRVTDPQRRTRLYSLNTASDRTLFFDLLSLNLGRIKGYRLAIQLYTVPGQVQYNATRRAVLAGADGVVFVADSRRDRSSENLQSLNNLKENLEANGIDPTSLPLVLLYNKRDLKDLLPVDELQRELNPGELPAYPSVAITGEGVMDAFASITENTLVSLADRFGIDPGGIAIERLKLQTRAALEPFVTASPPADEAKDIMVTVSESAPDENGPLPRDSLVSEAVRANLAMTDLSARLESTSRQLERKAHITRAITDFGRSIANERDPAAVIRRLLRTAVSHLGVQAAAVLIAPAAGQLREAVVHGIEADPLLSATIEGASIAGELATAGEPILIARDLEGVTAGPAQLEVEKAGFASAVVVPLTAQDRLLGLLTAYGGFDRPLLDEEELGLASILGATAAMGYANALAFRQLEESNTGLKSSVAQRDGELKTSVEEIQHLNRELTALDAVKNELISKVADQLRAPVGSIVSAAGALHSLRDAPVAKTARFVEIIRSQAETLSELIESVSQASLFVSETGAGRLEPTPLPTLIRETVAPLDDFARALSVEIKMLSPGALKTVSCDAETLTTALRAMVKNAIEHSPEGGEVRIEVRRVRRGSEPWIEFAVSDSGEGIAEADREKVYDFFWQGEDEKRGGYKGMGIGLAIGRQVAVRHGGRMVIEDRDPTGARVSMLLPQPGLD